MSLREILGEARIPNWARLIIAGMQLGFVIAAGYYGLRFAVSEFRGAQTSAVQDLRYELRELRRDVRWTGVQDSIRSAEMAREIGAVQATLDRRTRQTNAELEMVWRSLRWPARGRQSIE